MWSKPTQAEETFNSIAKNCDGSNRTPNSSIRQRARQMCNQWKLFCWIGEIEQALLDEEPDADALITKILHRAELEYEFCSAGDADPATMQIQKRVLSMRQQRNFRKPL